MNKLVLILVGITLAVMTSCSQSAKIQTFGGESISQIIAEKRPFAIDVNRAIPQSGRTVQLTSAYTLTVSPEEVTSNLPYFGSAYNVPYSDGGDGLNFTSSIKDYTEVRGKDSMIIISFTVLNENDRFTFRINIYPNGRSDIQVTSLQRQPIGYSGTFRRVD